MNDIKAKHTRIVEKTIRHLVTDPATQSIFFMWPNLVDVTERFCNFVSPLMPSGNSSETLVTESIKSAIENYEQEKVEQNKPKAFVLGLIEHSASTLNGLIVQGIREDAVITWEPYIEPMVNWMSRNQVLTLRTAPDRRKRSASAAKAAMLVHILSAQEMDDMLLNIAS